MATEWTSADNITRADSRASARDLEIGGGTSEARGHEMHMRESRLPRPSGPVTPLQQQCDTDVDYDTAPDTPTPVHRRQAAFNSTAGQVTNKSPLSLQTPRNYGATEEQQRSAVHDKDIDVEKASGTSSVSGARTVSTTGEHLHEYDCCVVPPCCTTNRVRCYLCCVALSIVLIALFVTMAGLTLAWGIHSVEPHSFEPSSSLHLSAFSVVNITGRHDGLYYKQICLNSTSTDSEFHASLRKQNCDSAFKTIHTVKRPVTFSGNFTQERNYRGLLFHWLEKTTFKLTVTTSSSGTTVYILMDRGEEAVEDLVNDCTNIANGNENEKDRLLLKKYLLHPEAGQSSNISLTLNQTAYYYLCTVYDENQVESTHGYTLSVWPKEFKFHEFSKSSRTKDGLYCTSYRKTIFQELANPTCMFIKTSNSASDNTTLLGSSFPVVTRAKRRIDELYYFVGASIVLLMLMAVSTVICTSIMCMVGRNVNIYEFIVRFSYFKRLPTDEQVSSS